MKLLTLATLVLATSAASAQSRTAVIHRLDSIAESPVIEKRVAGLAVAVVKGNDTLLMKGYGKANLEWDVPMPADAVFEIGSVTKQFTAAAILQLRDEGKLSLDDDITKYVPDWKPAHRVTLRRLLDHTSGLVGITEMPEFGALVMSRQPRDSALALIKRYPFQFAPGDAQVYNNSAFWLLGLVIEKASGMSYEDYVEQKIFTPLGMTRSMYCNSDEFVPRRAFGYGIQGAAIRRAPMNVHRWPYSAGSLCSTAGDMVTWLKALHGGKVLSPGSYAEMIAPSKLNDGTPLRYGMGIGLDEDTPGVRKISHGGAIAGYLAEAAWYPDSNLYVVMLINSNGNASPSAFVRELAAEIIPWTPPAMRPYVGDAAPFVGTYRGPSRGRDMTVVITAGSQGILASVNGAQARPLSWEKESTFRLGGNIATFRRAGAGGPVTELRWDTGGGHYVLKRQ